MQKELASTFFNCTRFTLKIGTLALAFLLVSIQVFSDEAKVHRVIDGDTFETLSGERVRMIGIDAPERGSHLYARSSHFLSQLIEGRLVKLSSDRLTDNKDKYGRLLRYVRIDSHDINLEMIEAGMARAFLEFPFIHAGEYENAQRSARKDKRGMWDEGKRSSRTEFEYTKWFWPALALAVVVVLIVRTFQRRKKRS